MSAAINERRTLEGAERRMVFLGGMTLLVLATLWALLPRIVSVPVAFALGWLGLSLLWKAWRLKKAPQPASPELPTSVEGPVSVPAGRPARSARLRSGSPS